MCWRSWVVESDGQRVVREMRVGKASRSSLR